MVLGLGLMLGLSACTYIPTYRMDVNQGNIVTDEMLSKLKVGMTKEQVRFVMGDPTLNPKLNADRWDYLNHTTKGRKAPHHYHIILFFKGDVLHKISGDNKPL